MKKILIDTDFLDDIDDALALAFALKSKDIEIVGITTTYMDTVFRAKAVKKFLSAFGQKDIPVYAGYGQTDGGFNFHPLDIKAVYDGLYEDFSVNENPEDAVDFIIDCAKKYGKDLTIVAIGPFKNIARVIEKAPGVLDGVDKVVIMGGAYFKQYADWNVFCDPVSAKTLFDNCKNLFAVGADVTHKLAVPQPLTDKLLSYDGDNDGIKMLSKHADIWQNAGLKAYGAKPKLILHDPLAIYCVISEKFVTTENAKVLVVTDGAMAGFTFNVDAYSKSGLNPFYQTQNLNKITVCREVLAQDFIEEYFKIILN